MLVGLVLGGIVGGGRHLTVLGSNLGLAGAYCVTSDKSLYLSEPVSSLGTYLRVALWRVQQMLYVKRKMQYQAYSKYL